MAIDRSPKGENTIFFTGSDRLLRNVQFHLRQEFGEGVVLVNPAHDVPDLKRRLGFNNGLPLTLIVEDNNTQDWYFSYLELSRTRTTSGKIFILTAAENLEAALQQNSYLNPNHRSEVVFTSVDDPELGRLLKENLSEAVEANKSYPRAQPDRVVCTERSLWGPTTRWYQSGKEEHSI